jgi:hypothetical protein
MYSALFLAVHVRFVYKYSNARFSSKAALSCTEQRFFYDIDCLKCQ